MRLVSFAGLVCFCALLASCAELPQRASSDLDWRDREVQLKALSHWKASGKIAIRSAEQSESATMEWDQANNITRILLSGPMGLGAVSIASDENSLQISQNGESQHYDISSGSSERAVVGWDLPLQALPYWVLGLPAPREPVQEQVVEQGLLRRVKQLGWTVTYEGYDQFAQYLLPTRLKIERNDTRARLIIRKWSGFSN